MSIFKYISVLFLLCLLATVIFIATVDGEFKIERSKIINAPKSLASNFVGDYKNWDEFCSWLMENESIKKEFPDNNCLQWQGENVFGEVHTILPKTKGNLKQKLDYNGAKSEISWWFKDTLGGTKVVCKANGKLNFFQKITTYLNGGSDLVVGEIIDDSLYNLDRAIDQKLSSIEK